MTTTMPDPTWQRDRASAEAFQGCAVPYLLGPWVGDLIEAAKIRPGARILDVACGTGAVSRPVASSAGSSGSVVGLDVNSEMLAVARQSTPGRGAAIRWVAGDAVILPFAGSSFDVVLCQQGLQFFPDRPRALLELKRVLAPSGVVAMAVWGRLALNPYPAAMARAADRHLGEEIGTQLRTAFALGDPGELRGLIVGAGFRSVAVRALTKTLSLPPLAQFIPRHFACTSVASAFTSASPEAQTALVADVVRELHVPDSAREAAFHFEVNLALAQ